LFFIPGDVISIHSENFEMRIAQSIVAGSIAILAAVASPALANSSSPNSHADTNAKAVDEASSPGCHAYQKGPDGSWVEMACHEGIETAPAPVHHARSASHHSLGASTAR
jgi:hypothetical protein